MLKTKEWGFPGRLSGAGRGAWTVTHFCLPAQAVMRDSGSLFKIVIFPTSNNHLRHLPLWLNCSPKTGIACWLSLKPALLPLALAALCVATHAARANPVAWGAGGASATTGLLDSTLIPATTPFYPITYTNVNGEGYDIAVTTSSLQDDGPASVSGTQGWWFQGTPESNSDYASVTFRFYLTGTNIPIAILGSSLLFEDAEDQERFGDFSYYDDFGNQTPVLFNDSNVFSFSNGGLFFANGTEAANNSPEQGGTQLGKTMAVNLSQTTISGFTIYAHRQTTSAGSVIMMGLGNLAIAPIVAWREYYFNFDLAYEPVAGDNANPAGDGIPNLLKYAFGLDPSVTENSGLPVVTAPDGFLQVSFNLQSADTDITYIVETSDDLVNWTKGSTYSATSGNLPNNGDTQELSETPITGGTNIVVIDNMPLSLAQTRFMRVLVTRP
jgi:hypothetical protein